MAYQPVPRPSSRPRATLDLPALVVPTSPQLSQMSEKYGATPTIIITPSSPSSDLDFQILHIPLPAPKPWTARLRMPWSHTWSNHGPIALESPPLEGMTRAKPSWLRRRLRIAAMVAVPLLVVAAHVVIARHYGLTVSMDFGGSNGHHSEWYVASTGSDMHSEA